MKTQGNFSCVTFFSITYEDPTILRCLVWLCDSTGKIVLWIFQFRFLWDIVTGLRNVCIDKFLLCRVNSNFRSCVTVWQQNKTSAWIFADFSFWMCFLHQILVRQCDSHWKKPGRILPYQVKLYCKMSVWLCDSPWEKYIKFFFIKSLWDSVTAPGNIWVWTFLFIAWKMHYSNRSCVTVWQEK